MDHSKSLQELENDNWGEPADAPTGLIRRCLTLRRVPIGELSAEDCRLLLGQKMSPLFLVPIALHFLDDFPIIESEPVPTALLETLLNLPSEFWERHQDLWMEVCGITGRVRGLHDEIERIIPQMARFERGQFQIKKPPD